MTNTPASVAVVQSLADLIRANITESIDGCWEWQGRRNARGYGSVWCKDTKKSRATHRAMYEATKGEIPDGLVVDHLCCNTSCCNPDHLEAVTPLENTLRGDSYPEICAHGHPMTPENTEWRKKGHQRQCRECRRQSSRRLRARNTAERLARLNGKQPPVVKVTQADRDAAADWLFSHDMPSDLAEAQMRKGHLDGHVLVQAFARHRRRLAFQRPGVDDAIALDAYRAAVAWIASDSWDGCSDCIEILRLARSVDMHSYANADDMAAALKRLRDLTGHTKRKEPKPAPDAALRSALEAIKAEAQSATSSDGKERDPWAIGRILKMADNALAAATNGETSHG